MKGNLEMMNQDYYLGLDIGTNSVGWAVSDTSCEYNLLKAKGKYLQGVRLFDEANGCEDRRVNRTNRRRLNRRKQRLSYLEDIFRDEILKIDPTFFMRLKNSFLQECDKENEITTPYVLFADDNFSDIDFHYKYPTIYHLRNELVSSNEPKDIRLVYIAIHHIIKRRGHFLLDISNDTDTANSVDFIKFKDFLQDRYDIELEYKGDINSAMLLRTKTEREKAIKECIGISSEEILSFKNFCKLLSGASVDIKNLFPNNEYETKKISLDSDLGEVYDELSSILGDDIDFIINAQALYNASRLSSLLGSNDYICQAKVELYDKNKNDLKRLKEYVKDIHPEKYKLIFTVKDAKIPNYTAYSQYKSNGSNVKCTQESFCKFLEEELPEMSSNNGFSDMFAEIKERTFLKKLKSKDNGIVPNQLHRKELKKILENASTYLPFLNESDAYGTNIEKILSIFDYKIPFYIGPLNNRSDKAWVKRTAEKIYPWNIENVVDYDASAESFMNNLIGKCEYTGEDVLPKDSLLYSKYMVLNEINNLKVDGTVITVEVKQFLYKELFEGSNSKVTIKSIKNFLVKHGYANNNSEISGIDQVVKSKLKSYHDFKKYSARQIMI